MRQNRPWPWPFGRWPLCWACALASSVTFLTGDHVMQIGFGQISPSASSTRDLGTRLVTFLTGDHVMQICIWPDLAFGFVHKRSEISPYPRLKTRGQFANIGFKNFAFSLSHISSPQPSCPGERIAWASQE